MEPKGWTTDQAMWENLHSMIRELIWRAVPLSMDWVGPAGDVKGVYFITGVPPMEPHESFPVQISNRESMNVLYVGISLTSLAARFASHAGPEPQAGVKAVKDCYGAEHMTFYWTVLSDMTNAQIEAIETAMIECFGPPGNKIRGRNVRGRVGVPISLS